MDDEVARQIQEYHQERQRLWSFVKDELRTPDTPSEARMLVDELLGMSGVVSRTLMQSYLKSIRAEIIKLEGR